MVLTTISLLAAAALAAAPVDEPAPAFRGLTSSDGAVSLEQFKGKTVVLEWTNDGCPFVQKHYNSGNMQAIQAAARADGAVWISVISSAPGKQGHVSAAEANQLNAARGAKPDFVVLDESGEIGKAFGAKTTPHMYVIDGAGVLRYSGAIDDNPSADPATITGAVNYVRLALNNLAKGQPVSPKSTKPYGCSVKYGS